MSGPATLPSDFDGHAKGAAKCPCKWCTRRRVRLIRIKYARLGAGLKRIDDAAALANARLAQSQGIGRLGKSMDTLFRTFGHDASPTPDTTRDEQRLRRRLADLAAARRRLLDGVAPKSGRL